MTPSLETWIGLLAVLGGAVGWCLRRGSMPERRRREQEAFSRQLIETQEQERKRIALELHDGLGQNLLLIKNRALLGLSAPEGTKAAEDQLREISALASRAIAEVREIAYDLRPHHLDTLGLTKAIRTMANKATHAAGLRLEMELDEIDQALAPNAQIHLYRIVQETLSNTIKHARASRVQVLLTKETEGLRLRISDDGGSLEAAPAAKNPPGTNGFGLKSIGERVKLLQGRHEFRWQPGQGTTLVVEAPFSQGGGSGMGRDRLPRRFRRKPGLSVAAGQAVGTFGFREGP